LPTPPAEVISAISLIDARQSSTWCCAFRGDMLEASNALDSDPNTMAHSDKGRGHWWLASFEEGMREVSSV